MVRMVHAGFIALVCLGLAACATTPGTTGTGAADTGGGGVSPSQVGSVISTVQQDASLLCSVVPAAADVAALLTGGNPIATSAQSIAQAICGAFTGGRAKLVRSARRGGPRDDTYVVNVAGHRVRLTRAH